MEKEQCAAALYPELSTDCLKLAISFFLLFIYLCFGAFMLTVTEEIKFYDGIYCCFNVLITNGWGITPAKYDLTLNLMLLYLFIGMPLLWTLVAGLTQINRYFINLINSKIFKTGLDCAKDSFIEKNPPFGITTLCFVGYYGVGSFLVFWPYEDWLYKDCVYYSLYTSLSIGYENVMPNMDFYLFFLIIYILQGASLFIMVLQSTQGKLKHMLFDKFAIAPLPQEVKEEGKSSEKKKKKKAE